jgi:hypothetical protein
MPSDQPSPFILDSVKASASRFRETKNALDARQKELEALKAELEARRADLDRVAERIRAERDAFQHEKDQVGAARGAIDRDLGNVRMEREKFSGEEKRIQDWARALNDREKAIRDNEERLKRLDMDLSGHLKEAEVKIQALVEREELSAQHERGLADTIDRLAVLERGLADRDKKLAKREEELIKLQNERLHALEAGEKEMLRISEEMYARQKESTAQHESFVELQDTLKQELNRLATEREKLAHKERSLIEAEKYLAAALEASGVDMGPQAETVEKTLPPPPASEPRPPKPAARPLLPPPAPSIRTGESLRDEIFEEESSGEARHRVSRADALERMTKALETAKKARDQGRNVSEIRKVLKQARAAFEGGDYDTASRLAEEILRELEAVALTR